MLLFFFYLSPRNVAVFALLLVELVLHGLIVRTASTGSINPFRNMNGEKDLLHLVMRVQRELRIFIYPLPDNILKAGSGGDSIPHFSMDYKFRQYLDHQHQESNGSFSQILVTDPNFANAFLIDHHHSVLQFHAKSGCSQIVRNHLIPILDNVIYKYPYYNRSGGADHFFFATYDKGEICSDWCSDEDKALYIPKLRNVSLIGNYGTDNCEYKPGEPCFRLEQDIVIPQPIDYQHFFERRETPKLYREFDSTFGGSLWGDRDPYLDIMGRSAIFDYVNGTEDFAFDISGGSADQSLVHRGYFMYAPCGQACWSMRLYHALTERTIPIVTGNGIVQAFEKFIDWTKITIKMSSETWHDSEKRNMYRKNMRNACDDFRAAFKADLKNLSYINKINPIEWGKNERMKRLNHEIPSWMGMWGGNNFSQLTETFIYNKMKAITSVAQWFDLQSAQGIRDDFSGNAFQLLMTEMWCRVSRLNATGHFYDKTHPNCLNPSNATARIEYF